MEDLSNLYLVIDVSNLAYRSAYAHKVLTTSEGKFSGHVFGACASLLSLYRNELSEYPLVQPVFCYDGIRAKDRRKALLPDYKAKRIPAEINPLPEVEQVLRLWPGLHLKQDDMEGDDAIAFAANMISDGQKGQVVVLTGDKDLWCLTKLPNVRVLSPNLKRFVTSDDIKREYHLDGHPERIPLAKALFGDASDDIKGIFRLQKKAVEVYLNAPGVITPDDFYQNLGREKPRNMTQSTWDKLVEGQSRVALNYKVVSPQIDFSLSSLVKVSGTVGQLKDALIKYECFSLLNEIDKAIGTN